MTIDEINKSEAETAGTSDGYNMTPGGYIKAAGDYAEPPGGYIMVDNADATDDATGFTILDDKTADWAIRAIAKEKAEYDRLQALADAQIEEIKARAEAEKKRYENATEYLKGKLLEYFQTVEHKQTKTTEKYKLLSGTLTLKKAAQTMEPDKPALADWCIENGYTDLVKTEISPKWAEIKKKLEIKGNNVVVTETGEVIACVKVVEKPGEFDIDF